LAEKVSFLLKNRQKFNKTAEDAEGAEEYREADNPDLLTITNLLPPAI